MLHMCWLQLCAVEIQKKLSCHCHLFWISVRFSREESYFCYSSQDWDRKKSQWEQEGSSNMNTCYFQISLSGMGWHGSHFSEIGTRDKLFFTLSRIWDRTGLFLWEGDGTREKIHSCVTFKYVPIQQCKNTLVQKKCCIQNFTH